MTQENEKATASRPLVGLTVVEMGHSVAAPFAGRILADLGARVIKIENPDGGDDARTWGPPFWHGQSVSFGVYNCNKLSAAIDIKDAAQCEALRRFIVEEADVVVQNMRHGLVGRFGLDAASLRKECPRLIYCNLAAFGATGPLAEKPGYDPLMQAFGGMMSITGEEGRPPVRVGPSIVDMSTGMWAVIGILSALQRRHATGEGCEIDTSLYESTLCWVGSAASAYLASGKVPTRRGSEMPTIVPYRVFEASDGYLLIAAGNDNLFKRLAETLGHGEWLEDVRFKGNPARVENRVHVNGEIQKVIITRPRAHWIDLLGKVGVPAAELQTIDEVVVHPQSEAVEMLQKTPDGRMTFVGTPLQFDGRRPPMVRAPPELGDGTEIVIPSPPRSSRGGEG